MASNYSNDEVDSNQEAPSKISVHAPARQNELECDIRGDHSSNYGVEMCDGTTDCTPCDNQDSPTYDLSQSTGINLSIVPLASSLISEEGNSYERMTRASNFCCKRKRVSSNENLSIEKNDTRIENCPTNYTSHDNLSTNERLHCAVHVPPVNSIHQQDMCLDTINPNHLASTQSEEFNFNTNAAPIIHQSKLNIVLSESIVSDRQCNHRNLGRVDVNSSNQRIITDHPELGDDEGDEQDDETGELRSKDNTIVADSNIITKRLHQPSTENPVQHHSDTHHYDDNNVLAEKQTKCTNQNVAMAQPEISVLAWYKNQSIEDSKTTTKPAYFDLQPEASCSSCINQNTDLKPLEAEYYGPCLINSIPQHLLLQIFKNLTLYELLAGVAPVCKMWYELSQDPDLWRVINLRFQFRYTDAILMTLTNYSDRVTNLDISDSKFLTEEGIIEVLKNCSGLDNLKLCRNSQVITNATLETIGQNCHHIKILHLQGCNRVGKDGLKAIAEGCPGLKELHLTFCHNVSDEGITAIACHCSELEILMLDQSPMFGVYDNSIMALVEGCKKMKSLSLSCAVLSNNSLLKLQHFKYLHTLDVSRIVHMTWQVVDVVARHCPKLESINISLNKELDDRCLESLAKYSHCLHHLYCVSCNITDAGVSYLGQYSRNLIHLDIGWCTALTVNGVRQLSLMCQSLRYIGLIRCDNVDSDKIDELSEEFPRIEYSTFLTESRKLVNRAISSGFMWKNQSQTS